MISKMVLHKVLYFPGYYSPEWHLPKCRSHWCCVIMPKDIRPQMPLRRMGYNDFNAKEVY